MADWQTAGALGNGIGDFVDTYLKSKQIKNQQDFQNQQLQLQQAEHGLVKDPTTGLLSPNAATQGQMAYQTSQYDPNNPAAETTRGLLKDTLKQIHPSYSDDQLEALAPKGQTAKAYTDQIGLIKPDVMAQAMIQSRAPMGQAMLDRNKIQQAGLDLRTGKVASDTGKAMINDPIVKAADQQNNSINKGLNRLSGDEPVTPQMWNELNIDLANAISGGRMAAQGTIHEVQMQDAEQKLAQMQQYVSGHPQDIGSPAMKEYLKSNFNDLKALNQNVRKSRIDYLGSNATAAFGGNQAVGNVVNNLKTANPDINAQPSNGLIQAPAAPAAADQNTKVIGGHTYQKVNGGWQLAQ